MSTIIRWNPVREMTAMQHAIDRLFEDNLRGARPATAHALPVDIYETDQAYILSTALPGVSPEEINVSLNDDVLTISGEVKQPTFEEQDKARALRFERAYGKFSRSLRLAQPIDSESIEAAYENGVLKLTLPKAPQAQPRVIPVRNAALN